MLIYNRPHASTKRVLAYKFAHPSYSTSQIAKTLNLRYRLVYNLLYTYKALGGEGTVDHLHDLVKDYEVKQEPKLDLDIEENKEKESEPTKGQKVLREVIAETEGIKDALYKLEKKSLHEKIDELESVIKAMKVQARGLENVIQYLEAKLGIDEIDARLESTRS